MSAPVMFAGEIAERLRYTPDYFRRHIDRLIIETRMPLPLPSLGRKRWDRSEIEAWLRGRTPPRAANDAAPPADPIEATRVALHAAYGRG